MSTPEAEPKRMATFWYRRHLFCSVVVIELPHFTTMMLRDVGASTSTAKLFVVSVFRAVAQQLFCSWTPAAVGYLAAALSGPSFHSLMLSDMTLIAVTAEWLRLAYPAISRLMRSPSVRINPRTPSSE